MAKRKQKEKKAVDGYCAIARRLPMSPSKIRPIADKIRQRNYVEVTSLLRTLPHKGAGFLLKTINSAAANAVARNRELSEDMLYVKELRIDDGPRYKRLWARARGRADRLIKRYSHIYVLLDEHKEGE